ncbi:hypothetical protein JCM10449v2_001360 [Rhodotorula kratochvilovae]
MSSVPESNAFLAYGVTVTTESLLYAVAAWPSLQGPFAFLDLVQLRRNNGTLRAVQMPECRSSGLEHLPSEIWDVVRHKVVDLELRNAEIAHVRRRRAEDLTWDAFPGTCDCWRAHVWSTFKGLADADRLQATVDMLHCFDLALPTSTPIRITRGLDALVLVIVDVSFEVPPGSTARFRRLISQLHLQLVTLTDGLIANEGAAAAEGKTELRSKYLNTMLASFGLAHPTPIPISKGAGTQDLPLSHYAEPNTATMLSLHAPARG